MKLSQSVLNLKSHLSSLTVNVPELPASMEHCTIGIGDNGDYISPASCAGYEVHDHPMLDKV